MDVGTYELPRWAKKRRSSKRARVLSTSYDFLQGHCSKYDSLEKRRRAGGTDDPEQGNFGPLDLCSIPFSGDGTRFGSTEGLRKSAGSCCAKNTRTEQVLAGFEDPWEHTLKSTELSLKFYNNTNHGVGFELVEPVCSHTFSAFVVGYPTTYWQHVSFKARPKGSCSSDLSTKLFFAEMARGSSQWNVTACTIVDPNDSGSAADSICKCWRICKVCVSGIRHPASGFEAGMQGLRIKNDSARARDGRFSIRCRGVPVTLSELIEIKTKEENKRNAKVARTKEELAEDHRELSIKGSELALEFYNSTNDGVNFELVETVCSRFFIASTIDLCCAHWRHVNFKARPKVSCSGDPSTMLFFAELRKKKLSEWIVTVCTILDPNGSANGTEYRCKCGKPEGVCEICGSFIRHPHPSTGFQGLQNSAGGCCAKNTRTKQVLAGVEDPWERTLKSTELALKFYNNTNLGVGFELVEPVCSHTFTAFVVGYPTTYWQHVNFKARPKGSCSSDLSTKLFFAEMARGSSQWNVTACAIVDPNDSGSATDSICKCWRICKVCVSGIRHPASGFEAGMQVLRIKNDSARARDGRFSIRCRGVPVTLSELIEIKTKEENKRNAKVARTKEELAKDHRELSIKGSELALEFYNSTNDGVNFELVETVCSRFFIASTIDLCCAHWRHVNFKARPKVSCSGDPSTMLFFAELRKKKLSEWIVTVCTILDPNGSANGTEYRCKCGTPKGVCEICGSVIRHPHPSTGFQGLQNSAGGCCAKNTRTKQVLAGVEDPWERTLKSTELALKFYNNTNHGVGFELVVPVCSHTFTAFVVGYPTTYWQHVNFKARPKGSCSSDLSTKLFFAEMARGSSQWNVTACTIVDPNDSGSATDSICKCWRICKVCVSGIRHPASGFEAGMQVLRIKNDSARARDGSIRYRGVPVTLSELIEIKTKEENKRNAKVARTKEELAEDHRELTIKGSELALEFYNSTNDAMQQIIGVNAGCLKGSARFVAQ